MQGYLITLNLFLPTALKEPFNHSLANKSWEENGSCTDLDIQVFNFVQQITINLMPVHHFKERLLAVLLVCLFRYWLKCLHKLKKERKLKLDLVYSIQIEHSNCYAIIIIIINSHCSFQTLLMKINGVFLINNVNYLEEEK